jgi:hypothetical protein
MFNISLEYIQYIVHVSDCKKTFYPRRKSGYCQEKKQKKICLPTQAVPLLTEPKETIISRGCRLPSRLPPESHKT